MPRTKHSYVNVHLFDNVHLVNSSSKAALEKGGNVAKMLQRSRDGFYAHVGFSCCRRGSARL